MVSARFCLSLYPVMVLGQEYVPGSVLGQRYQETLPVYNPYMQQQPGIEMPYMPYVQPGIEMPYVQPGIEMPYVQPGIEMPYVQPGIEMPYAQPGVDVPYMQPGIDMPLTGEAQPTMGAMEPLKIGAVHCAQAGDGRWWDVTIFSINVDGTYAAQVKDRGLTFWPIVLRSLVLPEVCQVYEAMAMNLQAATDAHSEPHSPLPEPHLQVATDLPPWDAADLPPRDVADPPQDTLTAVEETEKPKMPVAVSGKKVPWRVVGAAATAGAVPLIFGLTGAAAGGPGA